MPRRRLDVELVRRGLAVSRTQASQVIAAGRVLVSGAPAATAARQVDASESIAITGPAPRFVSRGGEKLDAALERFDVAVTGKRALDVGASTGGFTDCLLQRGAEHVVAVDVGHGQLAWTLRVDERVTVLERTNVRELAPEAIDGPVPLVVADVSFISLVTVAPALARCTTADADLVLLVKPQFEAGPDRVGKGGVVRDPAVHADVLRTVAAGLASHDLPVIAAMESPIRGADGNREFLVHCARRGSALRAEQLSSIAEVQ
jgi:23S rRNA (cytidine1920-2'-O)/16S rRNA (cytidine1409-2'-O)-methyltransferase